MTISELPLADVHVDDVMHTRILTTDPTTPLRVVARLMADQGVHAVAVADPDHRRRPWGIVSTLDIAVAAAQEVDLTAGQPATVEIVTVSSSDRLDYAAKVMAARQLTHLVVVDPATGHPAGILSSLDVARAYGG